MSVSKNKAILAEGPIGRTLVRLTIPMAFGMASHITFGAVDTYFVSRLDVGLDEAVHQAAMGFIRVPTMLVAMVAMGLGTGISTVISQAIGRQDHDQAKHLATHGLMLMMLLTVIFAAAGLCTMGPVFRMLGAGESTMGLISEYMTLWYIGVAFVFLPWCTNSVIRSTGDMIWPMLIMLTGTVLNIILDPLLIFGMFGLPKMGLQGAVTATIISRAITAGLSLYVLYYRKHLLDLARPVWASVRRSWAATLHVGIPAVLTNLLWPVMMGVTVHMVSRSGDNAVAGANAGTQIEGFAMLALWALSATQATFVGQNWGAGKFSRVHHSQRLCNGFSVLWGLLSWATLCSLAYPIAHLFNDDPQAVEATVLFFYIAPAGYGLRGACFMANRSFNAISRPLDASFVDITRIFLLIGLIMLGHYWLGLAGVFGGQAVGSIIGGLWAVYWFHRIQRRLELQRTAA